MPNIMGLIWILVIIAVPIRFIYAVRKKQRMAALSWGMLLIAMIFTLWLVSQMKYG